MKEECQNH